MSARVLWNLVRFSVGGARRSSMVCFELVQRPGSAMSVPPCGRIGCLVGEPSGVEAGGEVAASGEGAELAEQGEVAQVLGTAQLVQAGHPERRHRDRLGLPCRTFEDVLDGEEGAFECPADVVAGCQGSGCLDGGGVAELDHVPVPFEPVVGVAVVGEVEGEDDELAAGRSWRRPGKGAGSDRAARVV